MPLIGLTLGSGLARVIGGIADYLAAAAVIAVGAWMLAHGDDGDEQAAGRLLATRGTAIIALGVSISLDELAIGFVDQLASGIRICPLPGPASEFVAGGHGAGVVGEPRLGAHLDGVAGAAEGGCWTDRGR